MLRGTAKLKATVLVQIYELRGPKAKGASDQIQLEQLCTSYSASQNDQVQ